MGSVHITPSVYAPNARDGYHQLKEEAYYEHGHNSYNGTITTTYDFKMLPFLEGESSTDWFERTMHECGKREICCVEATHVEKNDKGWPLWHFGGWAAE